MFPVSKTNQVMAYDRAITVFSPEGRLYQVEYASKIIERGTPAMAVRFKDGIIYLADFNLDSKLLISESIEKIFKVDDNIVLLSAGLAGDARRLSQIARESAQENRILFDEEIEVATLAKKIASVKQIFTQYGGMRPFGVSFIFVGKDDSGFHLFESEPSGAIAEYSAIAIGRKKQKVMEFFEKKYKDNLTEKQAINLIIDALKLTYDKQKLDLTKIKIFKLDKKITQLNIKWYNGKFRYC